MKSSNYYFKKIIAIITVLSVSIILSSCDSANDTTENKEAKKEYDREYIEETLNLANNPDRKWKYDKDTDSWTLSEVSAVAYPQIPEKQGVSVCVPGRYVKGIDTDGDESEDVDFQSYDQEVGGNLVIDDEAQITSKNGQAYTAETAPVIFDIKNENYDAVSNPIASTEFADEGYISVVCGTRGKNDKAKNSEKKEVFTGDSPFAIVDTKNAIRFVRYNQLLGNLPGSADHIVAIGTGAGGTLAALLASTGNSTEYYPYEVEAGAVGIYDNKDGTYTNTVVIDDIDMGITDGVWGCMADAPDASLTEAEMALAFEYNLDNSHYYRSHFSEKLAGYLSKEYMNHINELGLKVSESLVALDINADGDTDDEIDLKIEYSTSKYPYTRGYGGSYVDLYAELYLSSLQNCVDELSYRTDITWFHSGHKPMTDAQVLAMTQKAKTRAFLDGRYATPNAGKNKNKSDGSISGQTKESKKLSKDHTDLDELLEEYNSDINEIKNGDKYLKNIVDLIDPIKQIGKDSVDEATWSVISVGTARSDISLLDSLNLHIAMLNEEIDSVLDWKWSVDQTSSFEFRQSVPLRVDEMFGKHVEDAVQITKPAEVIQKVNGKGKKPNGEKLKDFVKMDYYGKLDAELKDLIRIRTSAGTNSIPSFDVFDYDGLDFVFGSETKDARHWDEHLLKVMTENEIYLKPIFEIENK